MDKQVYNVKIIYNLVVTAETEDDAIDEALQLIGEDTSIWDELWAGPDIDAK